MTKTQAMSVAVLMQANKGMTAVDALKAVCGAAVVDAMISQLYDDLRAKGVRG